ncbi:MAG TPA: hypothetical protein VKE41_23620 [Roseiflexaceae bacterium]|nr:hypothetical protein [Roseiflexaceae bacterium]
MKLYRYLILTIALACITAAIPATAGAAPASKLATYTHPDGLWSVQYPRDLLHAEQLNSEVVIFISKDRHTFAAVDTLLANADAYGGGSDGSVLSGRAQATLGQIYGTGVKNTGAIASPSKPWQIGITFSTAKGSRGEAVYEQRGRAKGDYRINGFLFGYKASAAKIMLPALRMIRSSYKANPAPANKDLESARNVLLRYFRLLHDGYYDEAVNLYADGYDVLAEWNPDVPANHYGQLFAAACDAQLRCLEVRRLVRALALSSSEFDFVVEFSNEDGTLFEQKACCAAKGPPNSQFSYSVEKRGSEMRVHGLPVYVP